MEGEIPLLRAVNRNDAAAVQHALRNSADVNCVRENDDNKYARTTPLLEACHYGYDKIVRILLDAGANARWKNSHDCSPFQNACRLGHFSIVKMLLDHDSGLLENADNFGITPLCLALIDLHFDTVRFLLDRGANVHATNQDGQTTLMCACHHGANLPNVQLLLASGVDVEALDRYQKTALHVAAQRRNIEVVRELILQHSANMFAVDQNGSTPFDWISNSTNHNVDQFLGIYSNKMTQDHGKLALHTILRAAEYSFVEWSGFHPPLKPLLQIRLSLGTLTLNHFRFLLHSLDADSIRSPDDSGKLPIHIACRTNAPVEVLALLSELDPAALHVADRSGALPLHECCRGNVDYSCVRYLVEQGGVGTLATHNHKGALPLHLLCGSINPSLRTVHYLMRAFPASVATLTYSAKKVHNEELQQRATMNPNDNNDDDDDESPPSVETINKKRPSRRARLEHAGLDEYDREQLLIKDLAEKIHARNMQTSRHAIDAIREAIDAIHEAMLEASRATAAMSRDSIAAIQETGKRREADRLARQSRSQRPAAAIGVARRDS